MKNTEEILELNKRQKEFYNSTKASKKNLPTRIWSNLRNGLLSDFRKKFDLKERVYSEHKNWMGDISDKKILDLGCLRGNALSLYMAEHAREYVGIDLSDVAIGSLQQKIDQAGFANAKAIAIDFFSPAFAEKDFDIVYAYGVLHHFENFDLLISRLKEKLTPNGTVVAYDPLQTSLPIKIMRTLYRPFQNDKDWEWPFTKTVISKIKSNFHIEQVRGILGKSKYGVLLNILPLGRSFKAKKIAKMIENDWNIRNIDHIYSCMHVTMLLRNK